MELIFWVIFPIIIIGFIALAIKNYLHFRYFKIVKNYPKGLDYFDFLWPFNKYFFDQLQVTFPFFLTEYKGGLSKEHADKAKRLEKYIFICLILFYLGISMIVIGKILEE